MRRDFFLEHRSVIFNKGLNQSGTGSYKADEDALRLQVPVMMTDTIRTGVLRNADSNTVKKMMINKSVRTRASG